jgi:hypothetical protein
MGLNLINVCVDLQAAEIERRIESETKAEKHIQKLLLLGLFYLFILADIYTSHVVVFLKLILVNLSSL